MQEIYPQPRKDVSHYEKEIVWLKKEKSYANILNGILFSMLLFIMGLKWFGKI